MRKLFKPFAGFILCISFIAGRSQIIKDQPIQINRLAIDVKANCFSATTTLQIELYNPNPKILDGEYGFSLNAGQVVTGFALDINGHIRAGVIVDKQKGRVAYENTIRRRVDPGLLEITSGNNYRVRVYPMPANGTRKITITISEILEIREDCLQYNLPVDLPYKTKEFKVSISVGCAQQKPFIRSGLLKGKEFRLNCDSFSLSHQEDNVEQSKNLSFAIPLPPGNTHVCSERNHDTTSFILHAKPGVMQSSLPPLNSITIFWDVSSSVEKSDLKKELEFLKEFCSSGKISAITVVTFSYTIHETKSFVVENGNISSLKTFLESQVNDGGTQLGVIDCNNYAADAFILFSDGLSNWGSDKLTISDKPVYCVSSSITANQAALKKIASNSGGRYINLNVAATADAISMINHFQTNLISINHKGQLILTERLPKQCDNWITISGTIIGSNELELQFGDQGQVVTEIPVSLNDGCREKMEKILALEEFQALTDEENDLTDFCKYYGFVCESTSLIVLDNLSDYIDYGIEPPTELQEEYNKQLFIVKQKEEILKKQQADAKINNLATSLSLYNERIKWWDKNEKELSLEKLVLAEDKIKNAAATSITVNDPANSQNAKTENASNQNTKVPDQNFLQAFKTGNSMQEVVVTALGIKRKAKEIGYANTTIKGEQISGAGYTNLASALSGRVAGLTVYNVDQAVNSIPKILIRGNRSITGDNTPLIVIDGLPVPYDAIGILNPDDIESVTILKGGQAAVLYGSEGVNGVILITRKKATPRYTPVYTAPGEKTRPRKMEIPSFVRELNHTVKNIQYALYLYYKDSLGTDPAFYFDAAGEMFRSGNKDQALRILTNLAELNNENHQLLRAMGYTLEGWNMYEEAIAVYNKVLLIKEEEPQSYRDLALAYEKKGDHQKAIEILYHCLTKNWFQYENRYRGLRGIMLNEINAIINRSRSELDLSNINEAIIKPLPVDLRIVIDWNKDETDMDLHIIEPGGEECYYSHKSTNAGGRLSDDFTQGYGPEEYLTRDVKPGKYSIRINYFGDRYQKQQTPSIVKLTIYKNFGRPDQTVSTQSFVMDKQSGMIQMAEVKF